MGKPVNITALHVENVKRVKAVRMEPSAKGLTVIGGKNRQGKTSVLDAIAWALGGGKYEPSNPQRDGALSAPEIDVTLSNGVRVTRAGKNGALKVIDPAGQKAGQTLLDSFISQFALDLPKFLNASDRDKAQILLQAIGVDTDVLARLDADERRIYNERHAIGQIADAKEKHATELPEYPDAPDSPYSVADLVRAQQEILARNGENMRLRQQRDLLFSKSNAAAARVQSLVEQLERAQIEAAEAQEQYATSCRTVESLQDESTEQIEANIATIEAINAQVAANAQKAQATDEATAYRGQYDEKTTQLDMVRQSRLDMLNRAELPLPGLNVENGVLLYNGHPWDCMSAAEQLRAAVAIVRRLNPSCGFVLLDKLEQMDLDTLNEFGAWLEAEGLQVIATRVSTGEECSIVIEDGLPVGETYADVSTGVSGGNGNTEWKGEF